MRIPNIIFLFSTIVILLLGSGCNTTKYLQEDEKLLNKNTIEFDSNEKIKNKNSLKYDLANYHKQVPNDKFLGIFRTRLWFYYKNQSPSDTTKWDNWVKRVIAEPPSIHNKRLTEKTALAMQSHMQHKGYFNAQVDHKTKTKGHFAYNIFTVYPRQQYLFDSIFFRSNDVNIQRILNDIEDKSYLKSGEAVDVGLYDKEVGRLVNQMRNLGYLDFSKNHITPLAVDTQDYKVKATLTVLTPKNKSEHLLYNIGKVSVYPNYFPEYTELYEEDENIDGVTYMSIPNPELSTPDIRYPVLKRNVKLIAGELYKLDNEIKTKRRLGSLGIYKFISIKAIKRENEPGIVDFKIFLPSKKKQVLGADLELNTANNTSVSNNTSIGTALSLNYENKNLFKGAEILTMDLQGGVEFAINDSDNRLFNSVDVSASAELNIPKFVDYMGIFHLMSKIKVLPKKRLEKLEETASTRIKLGYNYLNLRGFYDYNSLDASFGYNIKPNDQWRIKFTQTGLTYFNPNIEMAFDSILTRNTLLKNSFAKQLFTGIFFRDVQASYTGKPKNNSIDWSTRMSGEVSGMEILSINKIFAPQKEWLLFDSLKYANYLKFELEQRYIKTISPRSAFAFRANGGIAFPYGSFSEVVPYVKQFYVGGPNSIRAWSIRQLGPGGFNDEVANDPNNNVPFYQTGDLRMEMNISIRYVLVIGGSHFPRCR